jgi:glutathione S-transferase
MLKLYHVPGSRSVRVRWFMEELGLEYELQTMPFDKAALQAPDYLKKSPLGKVPALEDGDSVLFESGAILEYLMEMYGEGRLKPATGTKEWERYLIWMHASESFTWSVALYFFNSSLVAEGDRSEAITADVKSRALVVFAGAESDLADRTFICGDEFTAADIMFAYGILFASHFDLLNTDDHPNLLAYFNRIKERNAFQRAVAD